MSELNKALEDANIKYDNKEQTRISFKNCMFDWNNGSPKFGSIIEDRAQSDEEQGHGILLDESTEVTDDIDLLFSAYIEFLYQLRNLIFHGTIAPIAKNERVVKQLYLTLLMIVPHD